MDTIRYKLKTLHHKFHLYSITETTLSNSLITLLQQNYPGTNRYFDSSKYSDGSQKCVAFVKHLLACRLRCQGQPEYLSETLP